MSETNSKPTVALIFSHGIGLRTWFDAGFFAREIDYYKDIADAVGNVVFLTYDRDDPAESTDIPDVEPIRVVFNNYPLHYRFFGLLAPLLKYRSLKRSDVIKTNQLIGSWTGLLLKWILRKPLLARCGYIWSLNVQRAGASRFRNWATRSVERFVLKRSNAIAVPDRYALNYLSELHGISRGKFTVLPNFVDIERFSPAELPERSANRFLFVGRLSEEKRPDLAIAGVSRVPEAQLDVIGRGADVDRLESIAGNLKNVSLLGMLPHDQVAEMMSMARGLVITSRYEGSPKAVIEAMSSGLPVIAVKAPGLIEIVEDGVNGLLVDPDDESIADAVRRLIDNSELWLKLSENGRRMAIETYSKKSVLQKEISLLNRLMSNSESGA